MFPFCGHTLPLPLRPDNHWSITFSRMSYKWNHALGNLLRLTSFTHHNASSRFFCVWKGSFLFFFFLNFLNYYYLFYLWLCWVFISVQGLSLVVASGGHSSSRCAGPSLSRPLLLRSTGSRRTGSAIVAHGPSCSMACGTFPGQGSNPCPLHRQADSQPLRHQGSPGSFLFIAE